MNSSFWVPDSKAIQELSEEIAEIQQQQEDLAAIFGLGSQDKEDLSESGSETETDEEDLPVPPVPELQEKANTTKRKLVENLQSLKKKASKSE